MTLPALPAMLPGPRARPAILWTVSLGVALLLHVALLVTWNRRPPPAGIDVPPAVLIDLTPAFALAPAPKPAPPAPATPAPAPPPSMQKPLPVPPPPPAPTLPAPTPLGPLPLTAAPADLPAPPLVPAKPHLRVKLRVLPKAAAQMPVQPAPSPPAPAAPPGAAPAAPVAAKNIPAAAASGALRQDWLVQVLAHIERFKNYPELAMQRGWEGNSLLRFTIRRDGSLVSVTLIGSSGHSLLDAAALQTLHDAAPLPPPPASIPGASVTLTLPVGFAITDR